MHAQDVVLILTQQADYSVDIVIDHLAAFDVRVIRFDTLDFPMRSQLVAEASRRGWEATLAVPGGRVVRLAELRSVWYRRPQGFDLPTMSRQVRQFSLAESRMALGGLLRAADCLWMNNPEREVVAGYKPLQLQLAAKIGLQVPPSLLTNDPEALRGFFEDHRGGVIYKTMSNGYLVEADGSLSSIYTSKVELSDLAYSARVRTTPCLFQAVVPKDVELRVTIVNKRIFSAEIHSQATGQGRVDWRRAYDELTYSHHSLPPQVGDKLLALIDAFGLVYAAVDMILTPDGEYVFLEINPGGQWGWLEDELDLPVSATIAETLASA